MVKALYIHIPFCKKICAYCDFAKVLAGTFSDEAYIDVLLEEIKSQNIPFDTLKTIYIGGGTPTAISLMSMKRLLSYLHEQFPHVEEFTLEANPDSLSPEMMNLFLQYGVSRLSLGVQTCDEESLLHMNRSHRNEDLYSALALFKACSFENFNLDFIYGYPGIKKEHIDKSLNLIKEIHPKHVSYYSLQIEPGTMFYNQNIKGSSDEEMRKQYDYIVSELQKLGIYRYEVSNFALPGYESKHNLTYWHDEEYYACGVSASGYIGKRRYTNTKSISHYLNHQFNPSIDLLNQEDEELEFLMLNLRLVAGFSLQSFSERFHKDFLVSYGRKIAKVKDYVILSNGRFAIHPDYLYTMDQILTELIA